MKRVLPLSLLLLAAACGGDPNVQTDRSAISPGPAPGTCQKTEQVCTASEPPICSTVCVDDEPSCELVEVCTLSEPSTCYQVCKDDCSGGGSISSPPGGTAGGSGGEPVPATGTTTCANPQTVCTASYPSTCYDYCADVDPECVPIEVCTLSEPSTCTTICQSQCGAPGSSVPGGEAGGSEPGSSSP
jgi:hypothetical protein